jgi:hypothetical protein
LVFGIPELLYSAVEVEMKGIPLALIFLILSACRPTTDAPTAPSDATPQASTPAQPAAPVSTALSLHYMDAANALAADDLEKAKASLSALAKESTGDMKTLAQAAAETGDIAATRERFKALSVVATGMELPADYAVAFCPMYKGGSKWVQKRKDPLANPYYGKEMLTCGNFVD